MSLMKTTIEIPDDLLIEAKKRAAEERTTLRRLFARGLRRELDAAGPGHRSSISSGMNKARVHFERSTWTRYVCTTSQYWTVSACMWL